MGLCLCIYNFFIYKYDEFKHKFVVQIQSENTYIVEQINSDNIFNLEQMTWAFYHDAFVHEHI